MFCLWINRHGFWHPPMSAPLIHQDDVYNVLCRTLMQLRCWNWWRCCFLLLTKTDRNLSRCQLHHRHHRWHRPSSSTSSVHCSRACSPGVNSTLVRSRTMMSITSMMNLDSLSKQSLLNVCYYGMFRKKQHFSFCSIYQTSWIETVEIYHCFILELFLHCRQNFLSSFQQLLFNVCCCYCFLHLTGYTTCRITKAPLYGISQEH